MSAFKTALTTIRRSPYQSMLAITLMTITFLVANAFAVTAIVADQVLSFFETRPQVIAFFQLQASDTTIAQTAETVRTQPAVASVTVVSKQQALELYRKDNQDNPLLLELVSADILPASIEVSAKQASDLPGIKQFLDKQEGIEEVAFQDDVVQSLLRWTHSLRIAGLAVVGVLLVTSFTTITVLVGMKTVVRRQAVAIMEIIGATHWYILAPFLLEGMVYGLIGAVVGWGILYVALLYATPWLQQYLGGIVQLPIDWQLLLKFLGASVAAGGVIGALASLTAARRLLRSS